VKTPQFELLSVDDLSCLPEPSWLVNALIPESGLSAIFGAPGAGKSLLAMDWALSVAAGLPWLNSEVKQACVVYVAAEGHAGLRARIRAWQSRHPGADLSRLRLLPEAVNLLEHQQVEALRDALARLGEPVGLLVIDTMARSMSGGDENSVRDIGLLVQAVDELRRGKAALLVHHSGLAGDRERGSTALRAAVDMLAQVKRDARSASVSLSCEKLKDAAHFETRRLSIEPLGGSCVLVSDAVPDSADRQVRIEQRILAFLAEHGPAGKRAIRAGVRGFRNEDKEGALQALACKGSVQIVDGKWQMCPRGPGTAGHATVAPTAGAPPERVPPEGGAHQGARGCVGGDNAVSARPSTRDIDYPVATQSEEDLLRDLLAHWPEVEVEQ
jgi:hypothetical protein